MKTFVKNIKIIFAPKFEILSGKWMVVYGLFALVRLISFLFTGYVLQGMLREFQGGEKKSLLHFLMIAMAIYLILRILWRSLQVFINRHAHDSDLHGKAQLRNHFLSMAYEEAFQTEVVTKMRKAESSFLYMGGYRRILPQLSELINAGLGTVVTFVITLSFFATRMIMSSYWWRLTLSFLVLSLVSFLGIVMLQLLFKKLHDQRKRLYDKVMETESMLQYYLFQVINDYSKNNTIQMFQMEGLLLKQYRAYIKEACEKNMEYNRCVEKTNRLQRKGAGIIFVFVCGSMWILSRLNVLGFEWNAFYLGAIVTYAISISALYFGGKDFMETCYKMEPFLQIMDHRIEEKKASVFIQGNPIYRIKNLSFRYPGNQENTLRNIQMELNFHTHSSIAIIGPNGSGKTTLLKVLSGLYKTYEGDIEVAIENERMEGNLSEVASLAPQEYTVFAYSLGENIALSPSYSQKEINKSFQTIGFPEYMENLSIDETSVVSGELENGRNISQGERQKISLARAVFHQRPLLIFDEPTAALDPISEWKLFQNVLDYSRQRPVLFVTHKVSVCKHVDHVVLMKDGEVIATGTHEFLLETCSFYREMWRAQDYG
ncbi:MAG: ABC transporter ATP-binding protein [Tissierellia bacterium]|nr:ABC transporter ATP-binding protein [Tissierellia bacterium]